MRYFDGMTQHFIQYTVSWHKNLIIWSGHRYNLTSINYVWYEDMEYDHIHFFIQYYYSFVICGILEYWSMVLWIAIILFKVGYTSSLSKYLSSLTFFITPLTIHLMQKFITHI
jgi:hypothetical protein